MGSFFARRVVFYSTVTIHNNVRIARVQINTSQLIITRALMILRQAVLI